jgi:hypothetical protein
MGSHFEHGDAAGLFRKSEVGVDQLVPVTRPVWRDGTDVAETCRREARRVASPNAHRKRRGNQYDAMSPLIAANDPTTRISVSGVRVCGTYRGEGFSS